MFMGRNKMRQRKLGKTNYNGYVKYLDRIGLIVTAFIIGTLLLYYFYFMSNINMAEQCINFISGGIIYIVMLSYTLFSTIRAKI